ncbi:hypothetical protein QCA50_011284 [Cerrena zonata]|uniref:Uncharacterized protein n=1 Tax=Cerrena zonata TaxID=2478898 RepID=A0AAW0FX03_9APHY
MLHSIPKAARILRGASLQKFILPKFPARSWRKWRSPPSSTATDPIQSIPRFVQAKSSVLASNQGSHHVSSTKEPETPSEHVDTPETTLSPQIDAQSQIASTTSTPTLNAPDSNVNSSVTADIVKPVLAPSQPTPLPFPLTTPTSNVLPKYHLPSDNSTISKVGSPYPSPLDGVSTKPSTIVPPVLPGGMASSLGSEQFIDTGHQYNTLQPSNNSMPQYDVPMVPVNPVLPAAMDMRQPTQSPLSLESDDEMDIDEGKATKHAVGRWHKFDIRVQKRYKHNRKPRWSILEDHRPASINLDHLLPHERVRFNRMYVRYRGRRLHGQPSNRQPFSVFKEKAIALIRSTPHKPAFTLEKETAYSLPYTDRWPNPVYDADTTMVQDGADITDPQLIEWVKETISKACPTILPTSPTPPTSLPTPPTSLPTPPTSLPTPPLFEDKDVDMQDVFETPTITSPDYSWATFDDHPPPPIFSPLSYSVPLQTEVETQPPTTNAPLDATFTTTSNSLSTTVESIPKVLEPITEGAIPVETRATTKPIEVPQTRSPLSSLARSPQVSSRSARNQNHAEDASNNGMMESSVVDTQANDVLPPSPRLSNVDDNELLMRQLDEWERQVDARSAEARRTAKGKFKAIQPDDRKDTTPDPPSPTCDKKDATTQCVDLTSLTLVECWARFPELMYQQQVRFEQAAETIGLTGACAQLLSNEPTPRIERSGSIYVSSSRVTVEDLDYRTGRSSINPYHEPSVYLYDEDASDSSYETETTTDEDEDEEL